MKIYDFIGIIGSALRPLATTLRDFDMGISQALSSIQDYLKTAQISYNIDVQILNLHFQAAAKQVSTQKSLLVDPKKHPGFAAYEALLIIPTLNSAGDKILIILLKTLSSPLVNIRLKGIRILSNLLSSSDPIFKNVILYDKFFINDH